MYLPPDDPEAGPADEPIDPPEDYDNPRANSDGTTADGTSHRELSTDKTLRASSSSTRTIEAQWTERGHEVSAQRGSQPNRGRRRTAEAPAEEEIEEFEDAPTFEDDDDRGAHLEDHTDRGRYSPITEVIHFNRKRRRRGGALTPLPTPRTSMLVCTDYSATRHMPISRLRTSNERCTCPRESIRSCRILCIDSLSFNIIDLACPSRHRQSREDCKKCTGFPSLHKLLL